METPAHQATRYPGTGALKDLPTLVVIVVGMLLRMFHLVRERSLWQDEAYLAVSIVDRSLLDLLATPLEYNQVAPPLYLILAKVSTLVIGESEFALRLPAFLLACGTLILFAVMVEGLLPKATGLLALFMISVSPLLSQYAAETKQYAGDAFAVVVFIVTGIRVLQRRGRRDLVLAGIVAFFAATLSHGAFIAVAGTSLMLLWYAMRTPEKKRDVGIFLLIWFSAGLVSILWTSTYMAQGTRAVMQQYWAGAFMPFPPQSWYETTWLIRAFHEIFMSGFGVRMLAVVFVVIAGFGAVKLLRENRLIELAFVVGPLAGLAVASALRLYPFHERLVLFILPGLAVLVAGGVAHIATMLRRPLWPWLGGALVALMLPSQQTLSGTQPSWRVEEIKPVLERVASRRRHADKMYVFYGAAPAMRFYAPWYGFSESDWTRGNANRNNPQRYLLELDQFRGEPRVWIIFSHDVIPGERAFITGFLDSVGQRIVAEDFPGTRADSGTAALLYDLSDSKIELHR